MRPPSDRSQSGEDGRAVVSNEESGNMRSSSQGRGRRESSKWVCFCCFTNRRTERLRQEGPLYRDVEIAQSGGEEMIICQLIADI
jgi:hypothetical protein